MRVGKEFSSPLPHSCFSTQNNCSSNCSGASWPFIPLFFLYKYLASCCLNQPGSRKVCILNGQDVSTLSKWLRVVRDVISLKEFKLEASPWRRSLLTHPGLSVFLYALSACAYVSLALFFKYFLGELYFKSKKVLVYRILLAKYLLLFLL